MDDNFILMGSMIFFAFAVLRILFLKKNNAVKEVDYRNSMLMREVCNENSGILANQLYDYLEEKQITLNYLGAENEQYNE